MNTGVCLKDWRTIRWSFDLDIGSTTDSGDLFLRPEYMDLPERYTVIAGLHDQIGARSG